MSAKPATTGKNGGFGAYVHWPFCLKKCPYCDFNSHVSDSIDHGAWQQGYQQEILEESAWAQKSGGGSAGPTLDSIFFGGGTPSLMEPKTVAVVIEALDKAFGLSPNCEITLEANPTSVEASKLAGFKAAGVNRVSMGVQSLREADLSFLGRQHSGREALAAVDIARQLFERTSFDLIYARPDQSLKAWQEELEEALGFVGEHVSLYQLTIEPGTQFETRHARGDFAVPDGDLGADFYELTQEIMEAAGLPAYEVSNHAKPGAESRHNMIYWQGGDWLALGPGAHGRVTRGGERIAYRRHRAPAIWLDRHKKGETTVQAKDSLSGREIGEEYAMMGLRTRSGISLTRLESLSPALLDPTALQTMVEEGLLMKKGNHLTPTTDGLLRLKGVLAHILS